MANPSRWALWVVTDSADPRFAMPWAALRRRRRLRAADPVFA